VRELGERHEAMRAELDALLEEWARAEE
jgi:hypothetical protein